MSEYNILTVTRRDFGQFLWWPWGDIQEGTRCLGEDVRGLGLIRHLITEPQDQKQIGGKTINKDYLKKTLQGVGFNNIIQHLKQNASSRNSLGSVWGTAAKSLLQLQPCCARQQKRGHPRLQGHGEGHSELSFLCPVNLINLVFTLLLVITQNVNRHNLCILFTECYKSL